MSDTAKRLLSTPHRSSRDKTLSKSGLLGGEKSRSNDVSFKTCQGGDYEMFQESSSD